MQIVNIRFRSRVLNEPIYILYLSLTQSVAVFKPVIKKYSFAYKIDNICRISCRIFSVLFSSPLLVVMLY